MGDADGLVIWTRKLVVGGLVEEKTLMIGRARCLSVTGNLATVVGDVLVNRTTSPRNPDQFRISVLDNAGPDADGQPDRWGINFGENANLQCTSPLLPFQINKPGRFALR
jgi:hypothetical protein